MKNKVYLEKLLSLKYLLTKGLTIISLFLWLFPLIWFFSLKFYCFITFKRNSLRNFHVSFKLSGNMFKEISYLFHFLKHCFLYHFNDILDNQRYHISCVMQFHRVLKASFTQERQKIQDNGSNKEFRVAQNLLLRLFQKGIKRRVINSEPKGRMAGHQTSCPWSPGHSLALGLVLILVLVWVLSFFKIIFPELSFSLP